MKRILFKLSGKQCFLLISCLVSMLLALGIHVFSGYLKTKLPHELVAKQWNQEGSTAHISVYFSESEKYRLKEEPERISFEFKSRYHQLLSELETASITVDTTQNPTARLVVYGYSAAGAVNMQSQLNSVKVKAYGVGGDFFQFHPLKLVNGGYFSESDLMQDRIVIDTETAWKLFGSNDVVGMFVLIQGKPHMIVGVYEREAGYFNDAAGNDVSCVFVSHETLYNYGEYHGIETLEYLIPNPVTGFALDLVKKQCSSMDVAIMEHQERFSFLSLMGILGQFGTRSMGLTGITFPYWENMARGYEDILAGILFVELILLAYVVIVLIGSLWYIWIRRKWRARDIWNKIQDFCYDFKVRRYQKKKQKSK